MGKHKKYTHDGLTMSAQDWGDYIGICANAFYARYRRLNGDMEKIVTTPAGHGMDRSKMHDIRGVEKTMRQWLDHCHAPC